MEDARLQYEKLEKRVSKLEDHYLDSREQIVKGLQQIDNLIDTVKRLPERIEQSMTKSMEIQAKEHEKMYLRMEVFEKDRQELKEKNDKLEKKVLELEDLLDARTVEADSKKFNKIKMEIVIYIIIAVLALALGVMGLVK